ncbi:MAG: STM3941 family protein [Flavobacteriaceae bacterium]
MNPNIEIPFDRKKILKLFIGCLLFMAAGLWLGLHAKDFETFYFGPEISPLFVKIVALSTLLFLGVGLGLAIKLFLCKQPAISMDDRGITFHLKLLTNGPIPWEKIAEIKPKKYSLNVICFFMLQTRKALSIKIKDGEKSPYGRTINSVALSCLSMPLC